MPLQTKVSGAWKHVRTHVKVGNTWKEAPQVYTKVSGAWKPLYSFEWELGSWGECSATCGGGTQTRTVRAKRSDGLYFNDTVGSTFIGTKPKTSQECNTHSCTECSGPSQNSKITVEFVDCDTANGNSVRKTTYYLMWKGTFIDYITTGSPNFSSGVEYNGYSYKYGTLVSTKKLSCGSVGYTGTGSASEKIYEVCRTVI